MIKRIFLLNILSKKLSSLKKIICLTFLFLSIIVGPCLPAEFVWYSGPPTSRNNLEYEILWSENPNGPFYHYMSSWNGPIAQPEQQSFYYDVPIDPPARMTYYDMDFNSWVDGETRNVWLILQIKNSFGEVLGKQDEPTEIAMTSWPAGMVLPPDFMENPFNLHIINLQ